jgi:response regulator RpfG family c-di-GMP phosphodiesterase
MKEAGGNPKAAAARLHRVMLVDDEEGNLDLMRRALKGTCEVECFLSGVDALSALAAGSRFDLVISDQRMPGMDGTEFLGRVRQTLPHVMRIMVTAFTNSDAMLAAINRGEVHRYIVKPWTTPELLVEVRKTLEYYDLERDRAQLLQELARTTLGLRDLNVSLEKKIREGTREHEVTISELRAKEERFALAIRGANDGL